VKATAADVTETTEIQNLVLDEQVAHLLRRAHQRASSLFLGVLGEHQLTPTQFFAMARLHERGQLSQNRLGRLSAMDPATIQGVIRRLEERGFIQRTPDVNDRRRMVLTLTAAGAELVDKLLGHAEGVSEAILEPLDDQERTVFVTMLKRIT
jgi:DNA-binding MarR family transcriptional regulator